MPAGRTTAAYNPADYDEFGNYIGGAPAPAPPPPDGTLPMADQSMYAAPIEAKYQQAPAPPPPTDAYNSTPSNPSTALTVQSYYPSAAGTPNGAPTQNTYQSLDHMRGAVPYSPPYNFAAAEPNVMSPYAVERTRGDTMWELGTQENYTPPPRVTIDPPPPPFFMGGGGDGVLPTASVDRNKAGLDKPFAPPVLNTYDKQDSVIGGWRGGRYISPAETQSALDQIAATGQPVGGSTGPLETVGNLIGSGASALGALGTGIADFFAPPPVGAQEQPTREITGAPDPTLAAAPPTVTSLPTFKKSQTGYAASVGHAQGPGGMFDRIGTETAKTLDELDKGAGFILGAITGQDKNNGVAAALAPGGAPLPGTPKTGETNRNPNDYTYDEDPYASRTPTGTPYWPVPGSSLPDNYQYPKHQKVPNYVPGATLTDADRAGLPMREKTPMGTQTGFGERPDVVSYEERWAQERQKNAPIAQETKTASGPKRPSSILDPSAYLSQLAKNDDRTFNDQSEQGKFIERLIADKYLDKNGNFTAAAGADGTLKNGAWTQVAVDAGLVSADKLGKKASFVDMLPYQATKGAAAGVTESTASETPATGAPAANSGTSSNSGSNATWVDYGGGGSRGSRSSGGNWGDSSGRSFGSRSGRSFGSDDGEPSSRWQDYAEDEDGDGQFSAAEIKRAKFRMKQALKRRGKKGRFGKGKTGVPSFPDSPQRQLVLSNLSGAFDEAFANFPKPR
jgi:hypothetical protein